MARLIFVLGILIFTGCSLMDNQQCRTWQRQGLVQGTLDSCTKCVGQLGTNNPDAISGCALAMDTVNLVGSVN
jgi:hypothetical protein